MISFQRNFFPALCVMVIAALSPLPALAVMPDEVLSDPVLESRARIPEPGTAVPRLPEPVDRRQQCPACPRSPSCRP